MTNRQERRKQSATAALHNKKQLAVMRALDVARFRAFLAETGRSNAAEKATDAALLAGMHKARMLHADMTYDERLYSAVWLEYHGQPLPQGWVLRDGKLIGGE